MVVGKDKPTFHASHHHVTAVTFLLIGIIIITTSISFVFPLGINKNYTAMAQQQSHQQQQQQMQLTKHYFLLLLKNNNSLWKAYLFKSIM
jgi:hypothetical protein